MYKNVNWIKRGAVAAVAAGLMLGALPGVAMAETTGATITAQTPNQDTTVVKKTWSAASLAQLQDNFKFDFDLTYVGDQNLNGNEAAIPGGYKKENEAKEVQLSGDWKTDATVNGEDGSASKTLTFDASTLFNGVSFSKPGIYTFGLKEQSKEQQSMKNDNVAYDETSEYTIKVRVVWADDNFTSVKVDSVFAYNMDSEKLDEEGAKGMTFNNGEAANEDLSVKKIITGLAADPTDTFSFTIILGGGAYGTYDAVVTNGAIPESKTISKESPLTVNLGKDDTVVIKNLPNDAKYTVIENDNQGYTLTSATVDGDQKELTGSKTDASLRKDNKFTLDGIIAADDEKDTAVEFTNKMDPTTPTGIVISVLPYVGLGAAAVAGTASLVISHKRRTNEEF